MLAIESSQIVSNLEQAWHTPENISKAYMYHES